MTPSLPTPGKGRRPGQLTISRKDRMGALLLALLVLLYVAVSMPTGTTRTYSARIDSMKQNNYKNNYQSTNKINHSLPKSSQRSSKPSYYQKDKTPGYYHYQKSINSYFSQPGREYFQKPQRSVFLQQADSAQLEKLPGIGPVLASRIVRYREKIGGFYSKSQLKEVYGISDTLYQFLESYLEMKPDFASLKKIDLNAVSLETLRQHPYLGWEKAKFIIRYREANGPFTSLDDLTKIRALDSFTIKRFAPYATIDSITSDLR